MGVVETQFHPELVARLLELPQRVPAKLARLDHVVVVRLGIKHRHPVMMHRGDHDVLHAGVLDRLDPFFRIEFGRIERLHHLLQILFPLDLHDPLQVLSVPLHLLAFPFPTKSRIHPPVDEHAEFRLPPPSQACVLGRILRRGNQLGGGVGVGLRDQLGYRNQAPHPRQENTQPHEELIVDQLRSSCRVLFCDESNPIRLKETGKLVS